PDPAESERRINAWISERTNQLDTPLRVDERYTLNFQVGQPLVSAGVTVVGEPSIADASIPSAGLETEWVITSQGVELVTEGPAVRLRVLKRGGKTTWTARFALPIPATGDSEVRRLGVVLRHNADPELNVAIYVDKEL